MSWAARPSSPNASFLRGASSDGIADARPSGRIGGPRGGQAADRDGVVDHDRTRGGWAMKRCITWTAIVLIGWFAAHPAASTAQNRVENGAFEGGTLTANHGDPHVMSLPPGAVVIADWTVEGAEIAWAEGGNPYVTSPT